MNPDQNEKKHLFSQWLEKLQQESWQLELLISGFALYGIWASREIVGQVKDYISLNESDLGISALPELGSTVLQLGWIIFFINLLTHVIFRGFWIGTIGLRYVSGEIDYESLNYSKVLTEYLKRKVGTFDDFIERLEKFCSVLFAYTFLLFFITLSVILYAVVFNALAFLMFKVLDMNQTGVLASMLILMYIGLGMFIMIDFLTFGVFKRIKEKRFAKVYKYFYIITSILTFSFLYRPLLYNFLDDRYTKRLIWWSIPYFLFIILVFPGLKVSNPFYPEFDASYNDSKSLLETEMVKWWRYEDLRKQHHDIHDKFEDHRLLDQICLESFECSERNLRFFIRQMPVDKKFFEAGNDVQPFNVEGLTHVAFGVELDEDSISLSLDDEEREMVRKFRENHSELREKDRNLYINKIDSIHNDFSELKKEYMFQKLMRLKEANFELYSVLIDGVDRTDELESHFYIHPNAGERGMLCFLPIDSLERGMHELILQKFRKKSDLGEIEYRYTVTPFMIP